ncbi:uncharacterized protein LOC122059678 isoform X2 [Macadamia integrifolia]|uniref:uncharacterized protein LOC122059678 isoform X2 n=1 Tax=Macadamia integrifolia TaxID=60698 RepID=UPI001C52F182|nr:uncharacterized protein LOC122059678 isoform X2 [Macadamia integrifolia]
MSNLEKLFVQVFERKNWIIDQVKQQRDLYEQQLASELLINGIRPPSWLWNDGTENGTADLTELKKQDLICDLLIPPLRSKVPSTSDRCTFYSKPPAKSYNEPAADSLFMETCASNKYFEAGGRLTVVPNCHLNENEISQKCTLNENCELDPTIASPRDQTSVRASDNCFEPGQSLAKIQRSRPRQKALELRNSAKAKAGRASSKEGNYSVYSGRVTRSRTACQQLNNVKELLELNKVSDIADDNGGGVAQRKTEKCPSSGKDTTVHSGRPTGLGISCKRHVQELVEMDKYSDIGSEGPDRLLGFSSASMQMSCFGKSLQANGALSQFEGDNKLQDAGADQVTVQKFDSEQKVEKLSDHLQTNVGILSSNGDISNRYSVRNTASSISEANDSKNPSPRDTWSRSVSSDKPSQIGKQLKWVEVHDLKKPSGSQVDILPCCDARGIVNQEKWNTDIAETDHALNGPVEACPFLQLERSAGSLQSNKSSKVTSGRIRCSKSASTDKSGQLAEPLNLVEGGNLQKASEAQVDILPCNDGPGIFHEENGFVATNHVSSLPAQPCSIYCQSNMHGASHGDGLEFLLKRLPSESSMLLEPKQLVFNDVEVYNLNEGVDPMEKGIQGRSLEIRSFSSLGPAESLEKVAISDVFHKKCDISMDELLVQKELVEEVVNREKEAQRACSEAKVERSSELIGAEKSRCDYCTTSIGKTSKLPAMSSMNATSKICEDVVSDKSPETYKTSSLVPCLTDDLITQKVGEKSPDGSQLQKVVDSSLPGIDVDPQADRSGKKSNVKLDIGPGMTFPEDCKLGKDAIGRFLCQMAAADSPQMGNTETRPPYYLRSSSSRDKNIGSSKLSGSIIARKSIISPKTKKNAVECSWPQFKRRKLEGRSRNSFTASARLRRGKQLQETNEDTEYRYLEKVENEAEAILEVQPFAPCEMNIAQPNASESPDVQMHENESFEKVECLESPIKLLLKEDELEGTDQSAETALACSDKHMETSLEGHGSLPCCLVSSPLTKVVDLISADQTIPEFEGHNMGEPIENDLPCIVENGTGFDHSDLLSTSIGQGNILEQLYMSSRMLTPLPHASTEYKVHRTPDKYQSLPNGLLEHMYLRNSLFFNADESKQVRCSYNGMSEEVDCTFLGKSYSDGMSSSSVQFSWDTTRLPCTPPVGKLCRRIAAKASNDSLEKQHNINPELTCFRIEEDPGICEENGDTDEMFDPVKEGVQSRGENYSTKKEPLADVTNEYLNPSASVSLADKSVERGSLGSVNAGFNTSQTQMDAKQKLKSTQRKYKNKDKENQWSSLGSSASRKATESLQTRISKPKLSGKVSEGKGGQSLLEKGNKRNNIVSNISSFIPFVQQKQPAAVTGKRDIKVKALEAAVAARRLEEKRENERKMKKEAVKLERARLEQENMRQLELNKKKKEEERKKKEADLAARKRLREEEERKEKERKRKCIEEARRQQREHEERLRVEKERRRQAADERECKGNERADEERKLQKMGKGREGSDCTKKTDSESRTTMASECDAIKANHFHESCQAPKKSEEIEKEISNLCEAHEDAITVTEESLEQSYAISPYQGSDDEEEEEDDVPNKFIPSWASENCLAQIFPTLNTVDPNGIFPPSSFCGIAEVLLPRKQQLT